MGKGRLSKNAAQVGWRDIYFVENGMKKEVETLDFHHVLQARCKKVSKFCASPVSHCIL